MIKKNIFSCFIVFYGILLHSAPPIPDYLVDGYTMSGTIPIGYCYGNDSYPSDKPIIYTNEEIESGIEQAKKGSMFSYGITDQFLYSALAKFPIKGKKVAIMGSRTPSYECIVLAYGGIPTTIEYNKINSFHPNVRTITVEEFEKNPETFDAVISVSSFEHDGLGRYGDPLNPDGDLHAMAKTKKMLKKGGLLFLAVPVGSDYFVWNAHRIYGKIRFPILIQDWKLIDTFGFSSSDFERDPNELYRPVFVLTP